MKKLLMPLLALVLCLCCCAAFAQSEIQDEFMGYWDLTGMTLMGIEMSDDNLSEDGFAAIHEDGMLIFSIDGKQLFTTQLQVKGGVCMMETLKGDLPVTIDDEGLLSFAMEADGVSLALRFARGAAPMLDAQIVPFVGQWRMEYTEMLGITLTEEDFGECTAAVYDDGYGILVSDGEFMVFTVKADENGVTWVDSEGQADPVRINEEGQLCFSLDVDGIPLTLVMNPVNAVPEVPVDVPAAVPSDMTFEGRWTATLVDFMGMELTPEELDLVVILEVSGDVCELTLDDEVFPCSISVEGNHAVIASEDEELICDLQADDKMKMVIAAEGLSMMLTMEREGGAPAVTPAVIQTGADGYDGLWKVVRVGILGLEFSPEDMEMSGLTLEISGEAATLAIDYNAVEGTLRHDEDGTVISDGSTDIPLVLNEDGTLTMTLTMDGLTMTLTMEREADVPAEKHAEPVKRAADYDGLWNAYALEVDGASVAVALLGMGDITLEIRGEVATLAFGELVGECTVRYEAGRVVVNDGVTDMPLVLTADGKLKAEIDVDGQIIILHMERVGGNTGASETEQATCSICGKRHDADKSETFGDMILCPDCYAFYFN